MPIPPSDEIMESAEDYETKSELNDMKQHADKIIVGIKQLNEKDANRAIWELFQNAVDLSEHCEAEIRISENQIAFSHNGAPFNAMTLDCLFKQLSSKTLEEKKLEADSDDPIGQYGTGFITTHSFGKEVVLNGALQRPNGFVKITDFTIDRNTENWKELAGRIRNLKSSVSALLRSEAIEMEPFPRTVFSYKTVTVQNQENVKKAIRSLTLILPYVMTLNSQLKSVLLVEADGKETTYVRNEHPALTENGLLAYSEILVNDIPQKIFYQTSADKKVTVIFPLSDVTQVIEFPAALPRLFLYYPLIGTESFGINFIFHSRNFQPTEPRDAVYLATGNESNLQEETFNQALIDTASEMVFDFLKAHSTSLADNVAMAMVNFQRHTGVPELDSYFAQLKTKWLDQYRNIPMVETMLVDEDTGKAKFLTNEEAFFWSHELLNDDEAFDAIHFFAERFFPASPRYASIKKWTTAAVEWDVDYLQWITLETLAEQLHASTLTDLGNEDYLKKLYDYFLTEEQSALFASKALLPNINGKFLLLQNLLTPANITVELLAIAKNLIPETASRFIHPKFSYELGQAVFSRKNLEGAINNAVVLTDQTTGRSLDRGFLESLIDYCLIDTNSDAANVPGRFVKLVAKYYEHTDQLIIIEAVKGDELDIRTVQKRLIRFFLNDISRESTDWVEENRESLNDMLQLGAGYADYKEIFGAVPVFPNRLDELCLQSKLYIDGGISDELASLYDKIVKPDIPLLATLAHKDIASLLDNKEPKTPSAVASAIENVLSEDGQYTDVFNHEHKDLIIWIIEKMTDDTEWERLFKNLVLKKANIALDLLQNENIKGHVYAIIKLKEEQISILGALAKEPNMEEIVKLGKEAVKLKKQHAADFNHKWTIGTHIEYILKQRLSGVVSIEIKAEVINQQDGQDIIFKVDGEPVYFIEVKSRWGTENPVRMSKNQTINAYKERHRYALCTVDMSAYTGEDKYEVKDIEKIRHLIYFNKNIGEKVEGLQDMLQLTSDSEEIHLDGDLRTVVPIKYIRSGLPLDLFEKELLDQLSGNKTNSAEN